MYDLFKTFTKEEFIEIIDLEAMSMYIFKGIGYHWMTEKTVAKYFKFCALVESILLAFSSSYMVKSGFSHVLYLLSKLGSTLNIEGGDLQFKLTNLQLNIGDLLNAQQIHLSPEKLKMHLHL